MAKFTASGTQGEHNGQAVVFNDVWVPPMLYDGPLTRREVAQYYHEASRTDYSLGEIRTEMPAG